MDTFDVPRTSRLPENHPVVSLILLLSLVLGGAIVFGLLSVWIAFAATSGSAGIGIGAMLDGSNPDVGVIKIIQAGSSIGMFVIPALLFAFVERRRTQYLNFSAQVNPTRWFLVIAIMFFSAPLIDQSIKINEQMQLPAALAGLENWMAAKEAELERLTKLLLSDTTYGGLLINLLVVAVIPAVGEELLFRGCVQGIVTRWFRNPHAGIWITAIIFSAIHLQFYGFLPRMLLGALFGYILLWGRTIWLPILAHFLNNGAATVSAFYLLREGKSMDDLDLSTQVPSYLYFLSFVLTGILLYQYYKIAPEPQTAIKRRKRS